MPRVAFALLSGLILAAGLHAQSMPEAAGQLASRISSLLPPRSTVSLALRNLSSLGPAAWSSFRSRFSDEVQKAGLQMSPTTQPEARVLVRLAESAQGLLFVAEVTSGDNRQVAMLPWTAPRADTKPGVTLVAKLLWGQSEPVLDVLVVNSGAQMLVLGDSSVTSYQLTGGKWTLASAAALTLARPMPRDPRGRIQSTADGFRVYVPGTTCNGTLQPALQLMCAPGNELWGGDPQVRWVTDRDLLESPQVKGAFFSAAAGVIDSATGLPAAGAEEWGSDIAGIDNSCGAASLVVADAAGADPERDQVEVYEIADGQASAASAPLALPGSVTALWPAEARGQATLVVHNSQTGNYEASRLGLACAQ